jgi:hypothetical protein
VKYWLRFGPAPPWQLDDLQPTEPTNVPAFSWIGRGSLAGKISATDKARMQSNATLSDTPRD